MWTEPEDFFSDERNSLLLLRLTSRGETVDGQASRNPLMLSPVRHMRNFAGAKAAQTFSGNR
jgi:hypothetical protein